VEAEHDVVCARGDVDGDERSNLAKPSTARTNVSEVRSATVCGSRHRRAK
jgi:hypothetical protein